MERWETPTCGATANVIELLAKDVDGEGGGWVALMDDEPGASGLWVWD